MLFEDRRDAGRQLARRLEPYREAHPLVLGLPRGGVVVAAEVAHALDAPLDVLVTRKLGAPQEPELAIGAIAPGGIRLLDRYAVRALHLTDEQIDALVAREQQELARRLRRYGCRRELPPVRGRTVIVVDDGLATGYTAWAAVRAVRQQQPRRLVLAVAVCAPDAAEALEDAVDDFVCVAAPEVFFAVGQWYRHFSPVTDDEVLALLEAARLPRHNQPPAQRAGPTP